MKHIFLFYTVPFGFYIDTGFEPLWEYGEFTSPITGGILGQ